MKILLALLIASSLTANAWLAWRFTATPASDESTAAKADASPPRAANEVPALPLAALEGADPAAWRDRLRAAGADEGMVRALVEGGLRQRYREQLSASRVARNEHAWWRNEAGAAGGDDTQLLRDTVQTPLRELLGRDPLELQDAEKRFDFLPADKRRRLAEIALDYAEMEALIGKPSSLNGLRAELEQQRMLAEERRKDVLAALTPAERAEYDLRFEGSAGLLSGRLEAMQGTEQEYRALRPVLDEMRARARALPKGDAFSPDAYAALNQQTLDEIAAAIGPQRALEYEWSGPGLYAELRRIARERGLPESTAARVLQLAAETGGRASAIHHDPAIPPAEKVAALQALQAAVQKEFDQRVPAPMRAELPEQAVGWLTMLGEGRYMGFSPSLDGTGTGTVAPVSVTAPAFGKAWPAPLRPRALAR